MGCDSNGKGNLGLLKNKLFSGTLPCSQEINALCCHCWHIMYFFYASNMSVKMASSCLMKTIRKCIRVTSMHIKFPSSYTVTVKCVMASVRVEEAHACHEWFCLDFHTAPCNALWLCLHSTLHLLINPWPGHLTARLGFPDLEEEQFSSVF
jgi:hypothetical protein